MAAPHGLQLVIDEYFLKYVLLPYLVILFLRILFVIRPKHGLNKINQV